MCVGGPQNVLPGSASSSNLNSNPGSSQTPANPQSLGASSVNLTSILGLSPAVTGMAGVNMGSEFYSNSNFQSSSLPGGSGSMGPGVLGGSGLGGVGSLGGLGQATQLGG